MFFAGDIREDLKIEADPNFDCVSVSRLKKAIVEPGSLSHTNPCPGEGQTRKDDGVEVLHASS